MKKKKDYLQLSLICELDGEVIGKRVTYDRAVGTYLFNLEDVVRLSFFIESYTQVSGTALDLLIDEIADRFKVTPEKRAELMERYWHKRNKTVSEIVSKWNDTDFEVYKSSEDFIQHLAAKAVRDFSHYPPEIKKGLLYAIWKHYEKESFEEMKKDIEEVPEFFKAVFDNCFAIKNTTK